MTLNGIDIASHQKGLNAGTINADFVIVKATGGTQYINPLCDTFYQQAKQAGKLLGIYHYAHEAYCPGTAEQEAEHFLKNVQGYLGEAVLVLDFEADNKTDVAWAKRWLDYVYQKTGIKPLFYTYTEVLNSADFSPIAQADYGLWLANYGLNQPQGYNKPDTPAGRGFLSVVMHQYTSSGRLDGWGGNLDLNVFYGDKGAWQAYAGKSEQAPTQSDGWSQTNGKWQYTADGQLCKDGWRHIDGKWYAFDADGWMLTGWYAKDDKWYYLTPQGSMHTGWSLIDGKWYLLDADGVMVEGWTQSGGKWYYLQANGVMAQGWLQDKSGAWYYLNIPDGEMVTGVKSIDGKRYEFDLSGKCLNP